MLLAAHGAAPSESRATAAPADMGSSRHSLALPGLRPAAASLLMVGAEGGDLRAAVLGIPLVHHGGGVETLIVLEVDGATLLEPAGDAVPLEMAVYAVGEEGVVVASLVEGLRIPRAQLREAELGHGIKLTAVLELPPGELWLHALVRDRATGSFGLARTELHVPRRPAVETRPLHPVFSERSRAWHRVEPRRSSLPNLRRLLAAFGVEPGGGPAALPVGSRAGSLEGALMLTGGAEAAHHLQVEILSFAGEPLRELPLRLLDRQPGPLPGSELVRFSLGFEDVEQGTYRLRASLRADGEQTVVGPTVTVVVTGELIDTLATAWPELEVTRPGERQPLDHLLQLAPMLFDSAEPSSIRRDDILAAYCAGLRDLAAGDRSLALARIRALDADLFATNPWTRASRALIRVQSGLVRDLVEPDGDPLLPLVLLHHDLFRLYSLRDALLAHHTQALLVRLLEVYVRADGSTSARSTASRVLASMAASHLARSSATAATELLHQAIRYDPGNTPALLALGVAQERLGRYEEAALAFRRLLREAPAHGEGHLRLGVTLARIDRPEEAETHLRQALDLEPRGWKAAVATQELARLILWQGREEEGRQVLADGVRRFPAEQSLRVQLALLADREHQRARAQQVLAPVLAAEDGTPASSRHRYTQWPMAGLEEIRQDLQTRSVLSLPRFAQLLAEPDRESPCPF